MSKNEINSIIEDKINLDNSKENDYLKESIQDPKGTQEEFEFSVKEEKTPYNGEEEKENPDDRKPLNKIKLF